MTLECTFKMGSNQKLKGEELKSDNSDDQLQVGC